MNLFLQAIKALFRKVESAIKAVKDSVPSKLSDLKNDLYGPNKKIPSDCLEVSTPTKLPNPYALTFNGAVSGSYDGSADQNVYIVFDKDSAGKLLDMLSSIYYLTEHGETVTAIADATAIDKNGFYTRNGKLYHYQNGDQTYGIIKIGDAFYYFSSSGQMIRDQYFYISGQKVTGLPSARHLFDEDGKFVTPIYSYSANMTRVTEDYGYAYIAHHTYSGDDQIINAFNVTLTADAGRTISSVTVTMGGVDITATAYANGVVTIAEVTGDVVITATAT